MIASGYTCLATVMSGWYGDQLRQLRSLTVPFGTAAVCGPTTTVFGF